MKRMKRRCKSGGFTLIEVVVALVIVTLGLGSAIFAMGTAMNWVKETRNRQTALHRARTDIENIRSLGFGSLAAGTYSYTSTTNSGIVYDTDYTVATTANTNLVALRVSVSWPNTFDVANTSAVVLSTAVSDALN